MTYTPPASATDRLDGGKGLAPKFPLCASGISQSTLRELRGAADASAWWDEPFEMGRASRGAKYCAAGRALFESFASLGRVVAPVYRHLLRARHAVLLGHGDPSCAEEMGSAAYQTVTSVLSLRVTPAELCELSRAYVDTIPEFVTRAVGARVDLVGQDGSLQQLGVVAGMVFAMLARASSPARLSWFESLGWQGVSRIP